MKFVLLLSFLGLCLYPSLSLAAGCKPLTPISLPIRNVTASTDQNIIRRGIPLSFGTPPQTMCMAVNGDWNNTILWGTGGRCQNVTTARCTFERGGAFDASQSSTWDSTADPTNETVFSDVGTFIISYPLGADTITLDSQKPLVLKDFVLKTPGMANPPDASFPMSSLGLGNNSTMLEQLFQSNQISSRSYGLWWGLDGGDEADQMDGNLVLGGYDAAKTKGSNFTGQFTTVLGCPSGLIIDVNDVRLNFPNGTQTTLLRSSGNSINMCIKPDDSLMSFPLNVWDSFVAAAGGNFTGGSALSYKVWGMDYSVDEIFQGDMTIVLNSGLSVTIPNHQLIVPDVRIADDGSLELEKEDEREVLIYATGDANAHDMPLLGQAFLSALYLHVNNDEKTFTLWEANPTTEEKLVAVGTACASSAANSAASPSAKSTSASAAVSSSSTASPKATPGHATRGEIAAAAIGGIIALAIPIAILLWWRKRAQTRRTQEAARLRDRNSGAFDTYKEAIYETSAESTPQHLSAASSHELASHSIYEMPSDRASTKYELGLPSPRPPSPVPPKENGWRTSARSGNVF